jgi:hypothetical protein
MDGRGGTDRIQIRRQGIERPIRMVRASPKRKTRRLLIATTALSNSADFRDV